MSGTAMDGRRNNWIKLPVDTPRHDVIQREFGPTGVAVWVQFMQACKRSSIPGRVPFRDEDQLRSELRIVGWELLDRHGAPFALRDFFRWTGLRKWTKRHRDSWPAIEYIGWKEEQSQRGRAADIPGGSLVDPVDIPGGSRENRRSRGRNTTPRLDKTSPGGETHSQRMARLAAQATRDGEDQTAGDEDPEQRPPLYVVGAAGPPHPRTRSANPSAAEGRMRTPATRTEAPRGTPAGSKVATAAQLPEATADEFSHAQPGRRSSDHDPRR